MHLYVVIPLTPAYYYFFRLQKSNAI